jgi:hypothetical protein
VPLGAQMQNQPTWGPQTGPPSILGDPVGPPGLTPSAMRS